MNNLINENASLPDLLAEGSFMDNLFDYGDMLPMPVQPDLSTVNKQIETLTVDGNTQSLQLKIERMKRRQLRSSLKNLEQAVQRPCGDATTLRQELSVIQDQQNAVNFQLEGDITALRALTFRCLTRMYQVMARLVSRSTCTPEEDLETAQLMQEIVHTFQHLHSYYVPSYV